MGKRGWDRDALVLAARKHSGRIAGTHSLFPASSFRPSGPPAYEMVSPTSLLRRCYREFSINSLLQSSITTVKPIFSLEANLQNYFKFYILNIQH